MSETTSTNPEQHIPPVITEQEAQAMLAVEASLAEARPNPEDNWIYNKGISGVTEEGLYIAVVPQLEDHPSLNEPGTIFYGNPKIVTGYLVRSAQVSRLAAGGALTDEIPEQTIKLRSSGPAIFTSLGIIMYGERMESGPDKVIEVPELHQSGDDKIVRKIYPIDSAGQPYDPTSKAADTAPEPAAPEIAVPQEAVAEQVTTRGLRGFLRRRR